MKLISIEPTPSPNSMKLNVSERLPDKQFRNFKKDRKEEAPDYLQKLLEIDGVTGVLHVADFIALDRNAKVDWKIILAKVRELFGEEEHSETSKSTEPTTEAFGESKVFVQYYRGLPLQVKINNGVEERRFGLSERFREAAFKAEDASANLVMEREWKEQGIRYGEIDEIGTEVVEELEAAYDNKRLEELVKAAFSEKMEERGKVTRISSTEVAKALKSSDWRKRYAALEKMDPTKEDIALLASALDDEKASIRRLATVYLGMIEDEAVLPHLEKALQDSSVTVRRTAGDCFSDIGSPKGIPAMIKALKDKNKLVRWRAAMFLYEVGDERALAALKEAEEDPEFEVSLQVKMARKRIESGEEAAGSVWQQMTEARKK